MKSKKTISLSMDKNLSSLINKNIINKSKYIEWLIYQDLKRNEFLGINDIII